MEQRINEIRAELEKAVAAAVNSEAIEQIRRMCEDAGMKVTRLRRVSEGKLKLGDLPLGKWRYLTEDEIAGLK